MFQTRSKHSPVKVFRELRVSSIVLDHLTEIIIISSVRSSYSHPDLLLIHHPTTPLFQITPVLNTGLSLSEPLQLYKGYNAI